MNLVKEFLGFDAALIRRRFLFAWCAVCALSGCTAEAPPVSSGLDAEYRSVHSLLDADQQHDLQKSHDVWLKYRRSRCASQWGSRDSVSPDQGQESEETLCYRLADQARLSELRERRNVALVDAPRSPDNRVIPDLLKVVGEYRWPLTALVVPRQSGFMAVGDESGRLFLRQVKDGLPIREMIAIPGALESRAGLRVRHIGVSSNRRLLVAGSDYGTGGLEILDLERGERLWTIADGRGPFAMSSDGRYLIFISAESSGVIRVADLRNKIVLPQTFKAHTTVTSLAVSPDGKWVLSGDTSGNLGLWSLIASPVQMTINLAHVGNFKYDKPEGGMVQSILFAEDGARALVARRNGHIVFLRMPSLEAEFEVQAPLTVANGVSASADLNRVVVGGTVGNGNCGFIAGLDAPTREWRTFSYLVGNRPTLAFASDADYFLLADSRTLRAVRWDEGTADQTTECQRQELARTLAILDSNKSTGPARPVQQPAVYGKAEVHVLGVYQAQAKQSGSKEPWWKHSRTPPSSHGDLITVTITRKSTPLVLVLASYDSFHWKLQLAPGVDIKAVILSSYEGATVSGLSPGTELLRKNWGYAYEQNQMEALRAKIRTELGAEITRSQLQYSTANFDVR